MEESEEGKKKKKQEDNVRTGIFFTHKLVGVAVAHNAVSLQQRYIKVPVASYGYMYYLLACLKNMCLLCAWHLHACVCLWTIVV